MEISHPNPQHGCVDLHAPASRAPTHPCVQPQGDPVHVAAKYAFLFVLFGNLYVVSGGAQLFFDIAAAVTGRTIGGPAKACIVSSALYGTVSGSPVADASR